MPSKTSLLKLLLVGASCAVIAACSDSSISSPGEQNQVDAPVVDGGNVAQTFNFVPATGCPANTQSIVKTVNDNEVTACGFSGAIAQNVTLPADGTYFIEGNVFVGTDAGADTNTTRTPTLTIEPGATIVGTVAEDYLVVSRGAAIDAQGTKTNPIVFTSTADLVSTLVGRPRAGDTAIRAEWGGLVINGRAPINACDSYDFENDTVFGLGGTVQCQKSGEGSSGQFGGDDAADTSGTLEYVQVRYAGNKLNNEDELNGIAFQGVGSGTEVNYIQVHNNADDGVEFFGGTVDVKHVVLTGNADDSFDVTDGWIGRAQHILVRHQGSDGDQGFEMDNNGDRNDLLPRSTPKIANFTLIGVREGAGATDVGMLLREGLAGNFYNGIVVDFGEACLDVDQDSRAEANNGTLTLDSIFWDCATNFSDDDDSFDEAAYGLGQGAFAANNSNLVAGTNTMAGLFSGPNEQAVAVTDVNAIDPWFDETDYIGAFSPTDDTTNDNWATGWTFGVSPAPSCPAGTTPLPNEIYNGKSTCQIEGTITSDMTLISAFNYKLISNVFVGADAGADPANELPTARKVTLTINPGVTVFGNGGSDTLVVSRGSKIEAEGTASAPIVFTSGEDLRGRATNSTRGQWGGLVINGRAPINACSQYTEDDLNNNTNLTAGGTVNCQKSGEGDSGSFGGATADDDSGSLRYVRVQYAGFKFNNEDELNGIAFQGVGSETDVNYIQVHNNADDGVEFFGGTVNAKHLVLTGNDDDSFDVTDGWTGKAQFVIVQHATDAGDQGFEMDNNGDNNALQPFSEPQIANFTLIGQRGSSLSDEGMLLREGLKGRFMNGIVVDFNSSCLDVDQSQTHTNANNGELVLESIFWDCVTDFNGDSDGFDESAFGQGTGFASNSNLVAGDASGMSGKSFIVDMDDNNAKGVVPNAAQLAVTAIDPNTVDAWFTSTDYIGAIEDANDDWHVGWTLSQAAPAQP